MVLFGIYFSCKLYRVLPTRYPASFWTNVVLTMLILLGPAVEDSATGKDVYKAFAVRMILFIAVALYAWAAVVVLEFLRTRRQSKITSHVPSTDSSLCL
jgi:purine-cytosine permease-like protein